TGHTNNDVHNIATAVSDQTPSQNATADTPISYAPGLSITKTVISVTDTNKDGLTDAGDVINYDVLVKNTGDVTLTGVNVTDPLPGAALATNKTIAVGGSLEFKPTYTILQTDIDNHGVGAGHTNNDIRNTATAVSNQTGPQSAYVDTPISNDFNGQPFK